jgi:hypothetical protein
MAHTPLHPSRIALLLAYALPIAHAMAQETRGICSITLLSDSSTLRQSWCLEPPVATIEPIVWLVEGTGVQVHYLPAGVTAALSNDTLTVSGTITTEGLHAPEVTTNEGCLATYWIMDMSLIVDPEFSCSVEGEDVVLHWPGMNATLEWGGDIFLTCTSDDGFLDFRTLFLPDADSMIWSGLPTNTELTFSLSGNGAPYCFPGWFETTCTIITTDVMERQEGDLVVRAVPDGGLLGLSSPVELREVRIHDMLGALVASRTVNARTASIPIASLAPGAFIVRVTGADGRVAVQRFIQQ